MNMLGVPQDQVFLVIMDDVGWFCRRRENIARLYDGDQAVPNPFVWDIYGYPIFVSDEAITDWAPLPDQKFAPRW